MRCVCVPFTTIVSYQKNAQEGNTSAVAYFYNLSLFLLWIHRSTRGGGHLLSDLFAIFHRFSLAMNLIDLIDVKLLILKLSLLALFFSGHYTHFRSLSDFIAACRSIQFDTLIELCPTTIQRWTYICCFCINKINDKHTKLQTRQYLRTMSREY